MNEIRLHTFGASGSGTTTLAQELSKYFDLPHFDTDDFYWKKTDPPFSDKNPPEHRIQSIEESVKPFSSWTLSGSLVGWGNPLLHHFTHAVFVWVPWEVRKARLLDREIYRYGEAALQVGGKMASIHKAFMEWSEVLEAL
jgi:adenylate kinase family enzyme